MPKFSVSTCLNDSWSSTKINASGQEEAEEIHIKRRLFEVEKCLRNTLGSYLVNEDNRTHIKERGE